MFAKILSFFLVYVLSIANLFIVLLPITFIFFFEVFGTGGDSLYSKSLVSLAVAGTSLLMLLFMFFDFLFSYTIRYFKKRCIKCKNNKDYGVFDEIFQEVKKKYGKNNVELYVSRSNEINAFAVGGLRQNLVVLTTGILNHYSKKIKDNNEFLTAIEGILSHEMSHIVNKDYFTALLLIVNERAINIISKAIFIIFSIFIKMFELVPFLGGNYVAIAIVKIYNLINWIINFFYKYIFLKIYNFIQLQISKSIEYRADKQGAMVVGGENMADSLSLLGDSGYFTVFSSHPSTRSRVKNVKNIKITEKVRPVFGSTIAFLFSFFIIIFVFIRSYEMANLDYIKRDFYNKKNIIINKYYVLKDKVILFINK